MLKYKLDRAQFILKNLLKSSGKEEIAIVWTGDKESTVLLHMVKKMHDSWIPFFNKKIPYKVLLKDVDDENVVEKIKDDWKMDCKSKGDYEILISTKKESVKHINPIKNLNEKEIDDYIRKHNLEKYFGLSDSEEELVKKRLKSLGYL